MKRKPAGKEPADCTIQNSERIHPQLTTYVGYCLHKVALRLRAKMDRAFAEHGLVAPQFGMMLILKIEGKMTQIELGSYMAMDKATMVRMVDGLEEKGFVSRAQDSRDRRAKLVELTDAGRKACVYLEKLRAQAERDFLEPLTGDERTRLKEIVSKLALAHSTD